MTVPYENSHCGLRAHEVWELYVHHLFYPI